VSDEHKQIMRVERNVARIKRALNRIYQGIENGDYSREVAETLAAKRTYLVLQHAVELGWIDEGSVKVL